MGVIWVNNVSGNDAYDGRSSTYAKKTLWAAYGVTVAGDTVRVVYTGVDYAYESNLGSNNMSREGSSWSSPGLIWEGYDPNGGTNRPTLLNENTPANAGYILRFGTLCNYIIVRDLKFSLRCKTNWTSNAILLSSSLADSPTNFKIYNCWFDGTCLSTGYYDKGMYVDGGSLHNIEVYNCYFKNCYDGIYATNNTLPSSKSVYVHNCVFHTQSGKSCVTPLYWEWKNTLVNGTSDLTFEYNTFINENSSTGGTAINFVDTTFFSTNIFSLKNNFCYGLNVFATSSSSMPFNMSPNTIGYNTFGKSAGTESYYGNAMDTSESVAYMYVGDKDLGYNKTRADLSSYIAGTVGGILWKASGWMTIPDFRPIHSDLTGTSTSTTGIRGALPSGLLKTGANIDTSNITVVYPYTRPTSYSGTATNPTYICDDTVGNASTLAVSSNNYLSLSYIGNPGLVDYTVGSLAYIGGKITATGHVYSLISPFNIYLQVPCKTRLYVDDGATPTESNWELTYKTGVHSNNVTVGAGYWDCYIKIDSQYTTDVTSYTIYIGAIEV